MSELSIKFDTTQFLAGIEAFGAVAEKAAGAALYIEAEEIIGKSMSDYVPVDTGVLAGTGYVEQPAIASGSVSVSFGFGGPSAKYAASVHENPRSGKTGGLSPQGKKYKTWAKVGQWKYLETPLLQAADGFVDRVGKDFWEKIAAAI